MIGGEDNEEEKKKRKKSDEKKKSDETKTENDLFCTEAAIKKVFMEATKEAGDIIFL